MADQPEFHAVGWSVLTNVVATPTQRGNKVCYHGDYVLCVCMSVYSTASFTRTSNCTSIAASSKTITSLWQPIIISSIYTGIFILSGMYCQTMSVWDER